MQIKQDPVTRLWCREDGAILMPPCCKFPRFRWTFGYEQPSGYCVVGYRGKLRRVHQIICRAFNGLAPKGKPFVDHIDRCKTNNSQGNLHWVSAKENSDNADRIDQAFAKYGIRQCEDPQAYHKAYDAVKYAKKKAQGLHFVKGPNGKYGWYPRICTQTPFKSLQIVIPGTVHPRDLLRYTAPLKWLKHRAINASNHQG